MGDDIVPRSARRKRLVMRMHLLKDNDGLGIQIAGGKASLKGDLGIFITKVEPHKAAFRDSRLRKGDELLVIDGQPLIGITHRQAVELLRRSKRLVQLVVATRYKSEAELLLAEAGPGSGVGGEGSGDEGSATSGSLQDSSDPASELSREEAVRSHREPEPEREWSIPVKLPEQEHKVSVEEVLGGRLQQPSNGELVLNNQDQAIPIQGELDNDVKLPGEMNNDASREALSNHQTLPVEEADDTELPSEQTVEPSREVILNSAPRSTTFPPLEADNSLLEEELWDRIVVVNGCCADSDHGESLVVEVSNMTLGEGSEDPDNLSTSDEGSPQQLSRLIGQYTRRLEEYQADSPDDPQGGVRDREMGQATGSESPELLLTSVHSSMFGDILQSTANSDFGLEPHGDWHQLDIAGTLDLGFRVEGSGCYGNGATVGGVFVDSLAVKEGATDGQVCQVRVGDQVLEVNGQRVGSMAYNQVVALLLDLPPNIQVLFGREGGQRVLAKFNISSKGRVRSQDQGEDVDDLWAVVEGTSPLK